MVRTEKVPKSYRDRSQERGRSEPSSNSDRQRPSSRDPGQPSSTSAGGQRLSSRDPAHGQERERDRSAERSSATAERRQEHRERAPRQQSQWAASQASCHKNAEYVEHQRRIALKKEFKKLDKNGDGMLSYEELVVLLRMGNPNMSDRDMAGLFRSVDQNDDGVIAFEEFVDHIFNSERLTREDCIKLMGREWCPVDEIRFKRSVGKDSKVSFEDAQFMARSVRTWRDIQVFEEKRRELGREARGKGQTDSKKVSDAALSPASGEASTEAAAIHLQKSFRGFSERTKVKRKKSWNIYQAVEYQVERNQTSMGDFLAALLQVLPQENRAGTMISSKFDSDIRNGWPYDIQVSSRYDGPHLPKELSTAAILDLLKYYAKQAEDPTLPPLHHKYVFIILVSFIQEAKKMPTVARVSGVECEKVTVIGDLHGQLNDLCEIFRLNGTPSKDSPYLFNGDLVDRGAQSLEVCLVIFGLAAASPRSVRVNRGNHEDMGVCRNYGFVEEIVRKYGSAEGKPANTLIALFTELFALLPLATVIDRDVLVLHGGISSSLSLDDLSRIERQKFKSLSEGPVGNPKQHEDVSSILWSDPLDRTSSGQRFRGCEFNENRGAGAVWGSDVSAAWLDHHGLALIVRSHECAEAGFDIRHDGRVMTLFSASNYYSRGSNLGAYLVIHHDHRATVQQFNTVGKSCSQGSSVKVHQSVSRMEEGAIEQLRHLLLSHKDVLQKAFQQKDPKMTGRISPTEWAKVVQSVTQVDVPWVTLSGVLAEKAPRSSRDEAEAVLWQTCLEPRALPQVHAGIATGLYKNLRQLEAVFHMLDVDGNGALSMTELMRAGEIMNAASKSASSKVTRDQILEIASSMDIDLDGCVNFNEFLEAFRAHGLA